MRGQRTLLLLGALGCVMSGCREAPTPVMTPRSGFELTGSAALVVKTFDQAFAPVDVVQLQETDAVVTVAPFIEVDPGGGLLVADHSEAQIRRYSYDGRLLWAFGRRGEGPGEFAAPVGVARISDSTIVVVDSHSRAVIWDEGRLGLKETIRLEAVNVDAAKALPGGRLLLSVRISPISGADRGYAHLMASLATGEIMHRFFAPPVTPTLQRVVASVGWASADVDVASERLVSSFSVVDTVYIHDLSGTLVRTVPLVGVRFPPAEVLPDSGMREWMLNRPLVSRVFWIANDRLGVQLIQHRDLEGLDPGYALLVLTTDGELTLVVPDAPQLHAVDRRTGVFYFDAPDRLEPNHLQRMQLASP